MFPRKPADLRYLGFRYVTSIDATHAFATGMYMQHDTGCTLTIHTEKGLQHFHHKIHRCEIIV